MIQIKITKPVKKSLGKRPQRGKMFKSLYLNIAKRANLRNRRKPNSKTKSPINTKFGSYFQNNILLETMKPDFWISSLFLNDAMKCPDWSTPGCHGNDIKNPASWFQADFYLTPTYQRWSCCDISFLSYACTGF